MKEEAEKLSLVLSSYVMSIQHAIRQKMFENKRNFVIGPVEVSMEKESLQPCFLYNNKSISSEEAAEKILNDNPDISLQQLLQDWSDFEKNLT